MCVCVCVCVCACVCVFCTLSLDGEACVFDYICVERKRDRTPFLNCGICLIIGRKSISVTLMVFFVNPASVVFRSKSIK